MGYSPHNLKHLISYTVYFFISTKVFVHKTVLLHLISMPFHDPLLFVRRERRIDKRKKLHTKSY